MLKQLSVKDKNDIMFFLSHDMYCMLTIYDVPSLVPAGCAYYLNLEVIYKQHSVINIAI